MQNVQKYLKPQEINRLANKKLGFDVSRSEVYQFTKKIIKTVKIQKMDYLQVM